MRRLRFYKILLPIVLGGFLVLLVQALDPPEGSHSALVPPTDPANAVEGVNFTEWDGEDLVLNVDATNVEEDEGNVWIDEIRQLQLFRQDAEPLIVRAGHGDITGREGERVLRFENDVVFEDPEKGLKLSIRNLEIDQAAEEARTTDTVELSGATLNGRARGLVYGTHGQPARLNDLELEDQRGTRLTARRAVLHDGLRDVELFDTVRVRRGEESLGAERMRVYRRADDSLRRLEALEAVSARLLASPTVPIGLDSDTLNVDFDPDGELLNLEATRARLERPDGRLQTETLRVRRSGAARHEWRTVADGAVVIESEVNGEAATLSADNAVALLDENYALIEATASGQVRFDAPATHAEADWAALFMARDEVRLAGSEKRKARLARLDTRVAAERITTDTRGERLVAENQVEATMLASDKPSQRRGLFVTDAAVHFVADRLEGSGGGSVLTFSGGTRAWQGERTLSADVVTLDQQARTLTATDNVAARIPRRSDHAAMAEADYVQVAAGRLDYTEAGRVATFRDAVRVQLAEGRVDGERMEVTLSADSGEIELVEAEGDVRMEFHETGAEGPPRLITGKADRLRYEPATGTVWLIGENEPATVRRVGADEGTTSGRVLRYQLDDGTLEVDSGAGGPARIRTSG